MRRFLHRPITLLVMAALLTPSITADPVVCKVVSPSLMNQQALETPVLTFFQNSFQRSASASLAGEARLPKTARAIPIIYHVFGGREFRLRELTTLLPGLNFPATNNLLFRLRDIGLLNYRKARLSGRTFGQKRVFHSLHAGIVALSPSDVDRLVTYVFGTEPVEAVEGDDDPVRALAAPWWKSRQSTLRARLKHRTPKGQEEAPLEDLHEPPDLEDVGMTIRPTVRSWTDHLAEGDRYATPRITLTAEQAWNLPFDRTPRPPAPTLSQPTRRAVQTPEPDSISAPDAPLPGTPVDRREIDLQNGDLIAWRRMPGWSVEEGTVTGVERFPTGPSIIRVLVTRANGLEDYHFFYDDLAKVTRLAKGLSDNQRQAMDFLQNSGVIDLLRSPLPLSTVDHLIDLRLGNRLADPAVWEDSRMLAAIEIKELTAGGLADPTERARVLQRILSATNEEWKRWLSEAGLQMPLAFSFGLRRSLTLEEDFFMSLPGVSREGLIALYRVIQLAPDRERVPPPPHSPKPTAAPTPRNPTPGELAQLPDYLRHSSILQGPWQFIRKFDREARHQINVTGGRIRLFLNCTTDQFEIDTVQGKSAALLPFGFQIKFHPWRPYGFVVKFKSFDANGKSTVHTFAIQNPLTHPLRLIYWHPGRHQLTLVLSDAAKAALAATSMAPYERNRKAWGLWKWRVGVGDLEIRLLSESERAALKAGTLKEIPTVSREFLTPPAPAKSPQEETPSAPKIGKTISEAGLPLPAPLSHPSLQNWLLYRYNGHETRIRLDSSRVRLRVVFSPDLWEFDTLEANSSSPIDEGLSVRYYSRDAQALVIDVRDEAARSGYKDNGIRLEHVPPDALRMIHWDDVQKIVTIVFRDSDWQSIQKRADMFRLKWIPDQAGDTPGVWTWPVRKAGIHVRLLSESA